MNQEIKLLLPDSLFESLTERANKQGVSFETLCLSLLQEKEPLHDPSLYPSLTNGEIRKEIHKVLQSPSLKKEEKNKRVKGLEIQMLRFIR